MPFNASTKLPGRAATVGRFSTGKAPLVAAMACIGFYVSSFSYVNMKEVLL